MPAPRLYHFQPAHLASQPKAARALPFRAPPSTLWTSESRSAPRASPSSHPCRRPHAGPPQSSSLSISSKIPQPLPKSGVASLLLPHSAAHSWSSSLAVLTCPHYSLLLLRLLLSPVSTYCKASSGRRLVGGLDWRCLAPSRYLTHYLSTLKVERGGTKGTGRVLNKQSADATEFVRVERCVLCTRCAGI